MESSPTRTRKAMPLQTIMQPLYVGLGGDAAELLDYLPKGVVVDVDSDHVLTGYVPSRIQIGSVKEKNGTQTSIYAYLSDSARLRYLPEVHLRGRLTSHSGWKLFSFNEVMSFCDLHPVFEAIKGTTGTCLGALTHVSATRIETNVS